MICWIEEHSGLLFLLILISCFAFLMIRQHLLNKAPTYTAAATVKSRRMGTARYAGKYSSGYNYLVTFALGDTDTVELYVGQAEFPLLTEGLRGQLVWQNENMLSFDTDM